MYLQWCHLHVMILPLLIYRTLPERGDSSITTTGHGGCWQGHLVLRRAKDSSESDHNVQWTLPDLTESTGVHRVFERLPPNFAAASLITPGTIDLPLE